MTIIQPSDTPDPLGPAGLGNVPTLGGNVSTAIPPSPTVPSAVQTQQSASTAAQAIAQAIVLPPIPYAVIQRLDPTGSLTMWLQTLVRKLGGYTSTPAADAELLSNWGNMEDAGARALLASLGLDWPETPRIAPDQSDPWGATSRVAMSDDLAVLLAMGIDPRPMEYSQGVWVPTISLTGGTGITSTTRWTRVGNRVDFSIQINGTGMTATANTSYFTLPFTPIKTGACAVTNTSVAAYGPGLIYTDGKCYLPTITSTGTIVASGTFFI